MPDCDVLIAGAGPVGGALARALRPSGLRVAVLDAQAPAVPAEDPRPLALSHGTRLVLERLGIWDDLAPATPIARIHVSQRGGFGRVVLEAAQSSLPALGYVLDYARLAAVLRDGLRGGWCEYAAGTVTRVGTDADQAIVEFEAGGRARCCTARLLVIADGGTGVHGTAAPRIVDYHQSAVSARVTATARHDHVAFERFTPEGPLALLPTGDRLALVWTLTPERAQQLCAATEAEFLSGLQQAFGERLGRFVAAERRAVFPLALRIAPELTAARTVRIGNAAQTLHPVAGQGLNLGLRDAWELAAELVRAPAADVGAAELLRRYAARRRLDRGGGIWFTHNLVRIFSGDFAPLRVARGLGLTALGALPPAQDFLVRRMTFGARG